VWSLTQAILDGWSHSPNRLDGGAEAGPEIWVLVPQPWFVGRVSCTDNKMFFSFQ